MVGEDHRSTDPSDASSNDDVVKVKGRVCMNYRYEKQREKQRKDYVNLFIK